MQTDDFAGRHDSLAATCPQSVSHNLLKRSHERPSLSEIVAAFPTFEPHPLLRNGHVQTIAGSFLCGRVPPYGATRHSVTLDDGDTIVLHDDSPPDWQPGDRAALLIHGLAGSHLSPYMGRIAGKLNDTGIRTFRMDLRCCGAGKGLARLPYHAGRSEDVLASLRRIERLCAGSPLCAVGFSLGGNLLLKLLGETPDGVPERLDRAAAINPCIDLVACSAGLDRPLFRWYDRHFARRLYRHVVQSQELPNEIPLVQSPRKPRRIQEFDELYTAPVSGFGTARNYYARCSSAQFIPAIRVPTLIIASRDDPLIPVRSFDELVPSPSVTLHITSQGGHLGFIGRGDADPDRRWMDWRIVDWATGPLNGQHDFMNNT